MTSSDTSQLFSETAIGGLRLPNRLAVAPMTRTSASEDGLASADMARYYARFARGGFGLVITEGTYPDLAFSQGYHRQPGIASDQQRDAWRPVVDAVHREGAKIVMQLMHAGALTQGNRHVRETVAPSAVQPLGTQLGFYGGEGPFPLPREITAEEIGQVIDGFVEAAVRAREAGFDGVEIHGANGYLLDQFLTAYTNQRSDRYGGSTENRIRLSCEVLAAVRQRVGPDYPVGIRISQSKVNDYEYKWANGEDDARVIFERLAAQGPDFIHVTEYDITRPAFTGGGDTLAVLARRHGRVPVIANGKLGDPQKAASVIASGAVDVAALGKSALANRDWPQRVHQGAPLEAFDGAVLQPMADIKPVEL